MKAFVSACSALLLVFTGTALGEPLGTQFTYQGELQTSGSPATGLHDLQFSLYDALAGGAQTGSTLCLDNVTVTDGVFTVALDFGAQFSGQQRFLGIDLRKDTGLNCGNPAGFIVLAPRQALTATPYAIFASNAGTAATAANATTLNGQNAAFYQNAGNLISGTIPDLRLAGTYSDVLTFSNAGNWYIGTFTGSGAGLSDLNAGDITTGTLSPARLPAPIWLQATVDGDSIIDGTNLSTADGSKGLYGEAAGYSGETIGVYGKSNSTSGIGVYGLAANTSSMAGVLGRSYSPNGPGVHGVSGALSGNTIGVFGESNSTNPTGTGVVGKAQATGGYFEANGATGTTHGVYGTSGSTSGRGVFGSATAASGVTWGGRFENASTSGTAVDGSATAGSGNTRGGAFAVHSPAGTAVYGTALATSGATFGLYGQNASSGGTAVLGFAFAGSGTTYGVRGNAVSANGWGVWADGRMGASGTKSLRIDHPSNPRNEYLLHYSAESPEVINFYSGNIILDEAGEAIVELPDYFATMNKEPRYTLTAVGAPMPMLHVAEEISDESLAIGEGIQAGEDAPTCWFRIAGGEPGEKVSWRVDAIRNDLWMQQNGAPVEVQKQGLEKGTLQSPELYGEKRVDRYSDTALSMLQGRPTPPAPGIPAKD
jgi:hypothetical protein